MSSNKLFVVVNTTQIGQEFSDPEFRFLHGSRLNALPSDITIPTSGQTNLGKSAEIHSNLFSNTVAIKHTLLGN
jgi:K+-transporting ATPase c subunit